jgi:CP12 domain
MKFTVVALIPAAASAFVMTGPSSYRYSHQQQYHQLRATTSSMAASEAIAAAMAASKQFGAASPEARVAWDTVEEINASDNRYGMVLACVCARVCVIAGWIDRLPSFVYLVDGNLLASSS